MFEELYKQILEEDIMLTYLDGVQQGSIAGKTILTRINMEKMSLGFNKQIYDKAEACINDGKIEFLELEENKAVLIEPFNPKLRLIVFGGGHIAKPLSEFAAKVGFAVTVIDDRPFFANVARFPEAERVICENFEKSFDLINLKSSDYVVIITRGHRYDGVVLRKVLNYDLSYIGMIGSRRRVKAMREELLEEGFSKKKLEQLYAPIGIDIAAVTPDEISVSILAQLISCKNKSKNMAVTEFDSEVMKNLCKSSEGSKALITILSSKGSVPRKAGAKMLTYPDGRTIGTIGGGCSESAVLQRARELMREAGTGFCIEHVDMTGDVAESEGMVCGGIMEVLIEVI